MAKLVIFGATEIARLAHYYFTSDTRHEVVAFTVDRAYQSANSFLDLPLCDFETVSKHYPPTEHAMFVGIGYTKMNKVRASKYAQAKALGYRLVSYVSSRCTFLTEYPLGDNCFILEDCTIQPFVKIGNNVTLWSGSSIAHDSVIEDHVFMASRIVASGYVHIGRYCFIGANATLRNAIKIAPETLIGAGAIIMQDTVEKGVYLPHRAELSSKSSDEIEL